MPNVKVKMKELFWQIAPRRLKDWRRQIDLVRVTYRQKMNRELNLFKPSRFSEKMQWKKLFEASRLYTQLSDKIAAQDYIAEKGFALMLIPQLWVGHDPRSIPFDELPRPFIIKSTHGSGHAIIVRENQAIDIAQITSQAEGWLAYCHGTFCVEPGYLDVPHRLVVEPLLVCADGEPPVELRVFTFDGVAQFVQYVSVTRGREYRAVYMSRDWEEYPWRGLTPRIDGPEKPVLYERALTVAEALSRNINHCRVDLYLKDDEIYVGEITLYSWSGIVSLQPQEADAIMGAFWKLRWPATRAAIAMLTRRWGQV